MKFLTICFNLLIILLFINCGGGLSKADIQSPIDMYYVDSSSEISAEEIDKLYKEAVVTIFAKGEDGSSMTGSGFVINPQGYIITNKHVIEIAKEIHLKGDIIVDGKKVNKTFSNVRIIKVAERQDIALLKIDNEPAFNHIGFRLNRPVVKGEKVYVLGSPLSTTGEVLASTLTSGIVSNPSQKLEFDKQNYLQIDANISPGNSGGPVFGKDGSVIGIATLKMSNEKVSGINFAVRAEDIVGLIKSVVIDEENKPEAYHKTLITDRINKYMQAIKFNDSQEASYFISPTTLRTYYKNAQIVAGEVLAVAVELEKKKYSWKQIDTIIMSNKQLNPDHKLLWLILSSRKMTELGRYQTDLIREYMGLRAFLDLVPDKATIVEYKLEDIKLTDKTHATARISITYSIAQNNNKNSELIPGAYIDNNLDLIAKKKITKDSSNPAANISGPSGPRVINKTLSLNYEWGRWYIFYYLTN